MDGNDSSMQCSTRSIVTDYFEWRLKAKNPATNRLLSIVRQIGQDCEMTYRSQTRPLYFCCSSLTDLDTLKYIHHQIASNLFPNGDITWTRIISLISFSAILAEHLAEQEHLPVTFIIPSIIDWTTHYIDIELHSWLERENYWVCHRLGTRAALLDYSVSCLDWLLEQIRSNSPTANFHESICWSSWYTR